MNTKKQILLGFLLIIFKLTNGQVETNYNNTNIISNKGQYNKDYKTIVNFEVPNKNISELLSIENKKDNILKDLKPFKFAIPVAVDLNISKLTSWFYEKEFAYSKFTILLNGALSTSINFNKFFLPTGTEIYIYNEDGSIITGPITEKENNKDGIWGSWVYKGAYLNIEIKTPIKTINQFSLSANNLAYGYKEIYKSIKIGGFGQSGPCNINVICPLGNAWSNERNSVSAILSATGGEFCTGSLIMNACNTNIPYYLTANHCFDANMNASALRFSFQAFSSTCPNPGVNTNGVMYNGSSLKARNAASDFCLLELNTKPPANSGLHYAGWSRSSAPASNATCIHHPSSDLMKISRANGQVIVANYANTVGNHWRANWSSQNNGNGQTVVPITEVGSSGAPLFNQNQRIIGQLHGGPSSCGGTDLWDFYGRFDLSWTGGGTNSTRLSNWLDPSNTGSITTNTTNINALIDNNVINNLAITGATEFCTPSSVYTIINPNPAFLNVTWNTISPSGIANLSVVGNTATLTRIGSNSGFVILSATISGNCVNRTISKIIEVGAVRSTTIIENSKDCFSLNITANTPTGALLTWTTEYGGLIDGNPSPFITTANTVTITSPTQTPAYVDVSYIVGNCKYKATSNYNFCPCPSWDNGTVNWINSPQFAGEPLIVEISEGPVGASYYKWYLNGVFLTQTSSPYLWTQDWPCLSEGEGLKCIAVLNQANCGGEVESLPKYCGNIYPFCNSYKTSSNVTIFPNPAKYEATIKLNKIDKLNKLNLTSIKQIKIMDKMGKLIKIYTNLKQMNQITLNISAFNDNIYFVFVSDGKKEVKIPIIIKK